MEMVKVGYHSTNGTRKVIKNQGNLPKYTRCAFFFRKSLLKSLVNNNIKRIELMI